MKINQISGESVYYEGRFAIIAGRFNKFITDKLIEGAKVEFSRNGIVGSNIDCIWVPGAFEIPQVAKALVESGQYAAVLALGAVIRGATPHFDYVAGECAAGIAKLNMMSRIPVIFGVLTTDTIDQAKERAGMKGNKKDPVKQILEHPVKPYIKVNKGAEAALAALEMASLMKKI